MSLLSLRNVSRCFGSLVALSDISMNVDRGELRAVIGPNGAGKTTLFNLVSGLFPPTSGQVIFDGESIGGDRSEKLVHRGIVRTFQITEIFLELTVYENLRIAVETAMHLNAHMWLRRSVHIEVEDTTWRLMNSVGMTDKAQRIAGELAHGDQRVVEVAIALARKPKLLLLDEPTAGMGEEETQRMVDLIRHLHKESGTTILFIEHDMNIIFSISDRITVLDNGRLLADGTPGEVSADEKVQAAYLGQGHE